ncbi:MAG: hypothetical protein U0840_17815 [Gemmataceae bacterium]
MAANRLNQTAVDYLTIILSPVLIMGLIGSLVFFLLEVLYRSDGPWRERLQWILFFFVFGSVLVARISMIGEIASRASLYGTVLALAAYLGLQAFIEYPAGVKAMSFLVNLGLVILVWWCAHRLTWDCTNVDEDTDMSGQGLLQASGLEEAQGRADDDAPLLLEEEEGAQSWWDRYQSYRAKKNKKRTLGVWVVYFSLAALPLFGLGQALLPPEDLARRQWTFWLLMCYVGCALGLLLTTCFLGLRRYLRQKGLQMPGTMTGTWLMSGATVLVVLLLLAALLPRPAAEWSPLRDLINPLSSAQRKASQYAARGDSPGKGEGRPGQAGKDGQTPGNKTGEKGEGKAQSDDRGSKSGGQQDGKSGSNKEGGEKSAENQPGDRGDKANPGEKAEPGEKERPGEKAQQDDRRTQSGNNAPDQKQQSGGGRDPKQGNGEKAQQQAQGASPSSPSALQQMLQRIGPKVKWIVFAILGVVVVLALLRGGLGFLANFTEWARKLLEAWRNFWANLFGAPGREDAPAASEEENEAEEGPSDEPFSAFANPFDSGKADRLSARALIRYTFRAVEAWAREENLERSASETAMEFLERLAEEVPALEKEARDLADLHGRAEYAASGAPGNTQARLRAFWAKLDRVAVSPLSA